VSDDARALAALFDALDRLSARDIRVFAEVAVLLHTHPQWAVWLPVGDREWTAVRPAGSRPPDPEVPMVWVRARTAGELAAMMRRTDAQLPGGPDG
jgi:hypothetical protein